VCERHLGPAQPTSPLRSYRCIAMSGGLEQRVKQDGFEPSADISVERFAVAEVEHIQRIGAVRMPRKGDQEHRRRAGQLLQDGLTTNFSAFQALYQNKIDISGFLCLAKRKKRLTSGARAARKHAPEIGRMRRCRSASDAPQAGCNPLRKAKSARFPGCALVGLYPAGGIPRGGGGRTAGTAFW